MGDFVTLEDGEVGVAGFGGNERFADGVGGFFKGVGVFGFDVDLLDLEGVVDFVKGRGGDEEGIVEVDVIEINWVVNFSEDADDDEALTEQR